jgi:hypothetical protein
MRVRLSIPLRLTFLPALAASVLVLLAALSLADLARGVLGTRTGATRHLGPGPLGPERPDGCIEASDRSVGPPTMSAAEALREIDAAPSRPAVEALWPHAEHRPRLEDILFDRSTTPREVRLQLLWAFEREEPDLALEAAREILREAVAADDALLLAAWELIARQGTAADLVLLAGRDGESSQARAVRERCRERLRKRVGNPGAR